MQIDLFTNKTRIDSFIQDNQVIANHTPATSEYFTYEQITKWFKVKLHWSLFRNATLFLGIPTIKLPCEKYGEVNGYHNTVINFVLKENNIDVVVGTNPIYK